MLVQMGGQLRRELLEIIFNRLGMLIGNTRKDGSVESDLLFGNIHALKTDIDHCAEIISYKRQSRIQMILSHILGEIGFDAIDVGVTNIKAVFWKRNRIAPSLLKNIQISDLGNLGWRQSGMHYHGAIFQASPRLTIKYFRRYFSQIIEMDTRNPAK